MLSIKAFARGARFLVPDFPDTQDALPLFPVQGFLHGRIFHPELGERVPGKVVAPANVADGFPLVKHADDGRPILNQNIHFRVAARTTSQYHTLGLAQGQSLARTHGDQIAFDLGNQPESETQHLAVDRIIERVLFLGRVKANSLAEALPHNTHQVGHRPAQPRHLGDDQRIAPFHTPQQIAQPPVLLPLFSADDLIDPGIDPEIPALGETPDFILLIGEVLLASAHPQITYNHIYIYIK